jgi:hypothetical protein
MRRSATILGRDTAGSPPPGQPRRYAVWRVAIFTIRIGDDQRSQKVDNVESGIAQAAQERFSASENFTQIYNINPITD